MEPEGGGHQAAGEGCLMLEGALTMRTAEAAQAALLRLVQESAAPELDLSGVTECDVGGLQLLLSAGASMRRLGRPLRLRGTVPPILADTLERAGFPRSAGRDGGALSLWMQGEVAA